VLLGVRRIDVQLDPHKLCISDDLGGEAAGVKIHPGQLTHSHSTCRMAAGNPRTGIKQDFVFDHVSRSLSGWLMATLATSEEVKTGLPLEERASSPLPIPSPSIDEKHVVDASQDDKSEDGEFEVVDDRFSMIPLQTPSASPRVARFRETNKTENAQALSRLRNSSVSSLTGQKSPRESLQEISPSSTHITTPAQSPYDSSRASSSAAMPIMMARQKERLDSDPNAHRASVDGHARLKEGFEKIQHDSRATEADIDWGEPYVCFRMDTNQVQAHTFW